MSATIDDGRREKLLRKKRFRYDLFVLLIAASIIAGSYLTYRDAPMGINYGDESTMGDLGLELMREGFGKNDFSGPIWWKDPSYWGSSNPRIGVYFFGLVFLALWDSSPPDQLVPRLRLVMAVVSLITVYVFFRLLALMVEVRPAFLGALIFAAHPVFRWVHVVVIVDTLMLLLSLFTMYFAARALTVKDDERLLTRYWLLTSIFAGLAVSARLFALALAAVCGYLVVQQFRQSRWRALGYGLAMGVLVLFIFFATNPLLWWDPLYGLHQMSTGHMKHHSNVRGWFDITHLDPLLRQTFSWFYFGRLPTQGEYGKYYSWLLCLPGLFLTILGVRQCRRPLCGLWLAFFLGFFLVIGLAACTLTMSWYRPKQALGPMAGAVALGAFGLEYLSQWYVSKVAFRRWRSFWRRSSKGAAQKTGQ